MKTTFIEMWGNVGIEIICSSHIKPMIGSNDWFLNMMGISPAFLKTIVKEIWKNWYYVRTYHACAPQSPENYYSKGILPLSIKSMDKSIVDMFQECANSLEINEMLAYMKTHYGAEDEKVFVAIDKEHLCTHCIHHLVYGSEYLFTSGVILGEITGAKKLILDRIKANAGIPTIFSCDIPLTFIQQDVINELFSVILAEGVRMIRNPKYTPLSRRFGFGLQGGIPKEWIISHTHPVVPIASALSLD